MKSVEFWFDVVSPYSHLAFARLPEALAGHSVVVTYRPVLFAGLLMHWGQRGPAEIAPKRDWTYRQVLWLGRRHGIEIALPAAHPFNPLPLLRLLWACAPDGGTPNRRACEVVLRHVWQGGGAAEDPARLAALEAELQPVRDPRGDAVKHDLRATTEAAAAAGLFGVPTTLVDGRAFWGFDGLEMLSDALAGGAFFDGPDWQAVETWPVGARRLG